MLEYRAQRLPQLLNLELKYIVATHGHAGITLVALLKLAVCLVLSTFINEEDNGLAQRAHNSNDIMMMLQSQTVFSTSGRCSLCWNCTVQDYGNSWSQFWCVVCG